MWKLCCLSLLVSPMTRANMDRIQSWRVDQSQVRAIHLAPGLGSILLFPCNLIEAFVGRSEDLKAQVSPNDKKVLFLNLKLNSSLPTNLIVRCEGERNTFVFDVVPSRSRHQDQVEIRSFHGRPKMQDHISPVLEKKSSKLVLKTPKLMEKGSSK